MRGRPGGRAVGAWLGLCGVLIACSSADESAGDEVSADPAPAATAASSATESDDAAPTGTDPLPAGRADVAVDAAVELRGFSGLTAEATVTADAPVNVEVTAWSGDHVVTVPRTAEPGQEHAVPIVGMRPDRAYDIDVVAVDPSGAVVAEAVAGSVRTEPLPAWMPEHQITIGDGAAPGYTLVETSPPVVDPDDPPAGAPSQVVIAYDDEGEIVWYYSNTGAVGAVEQTLDGTFLNHYWPFGIREVDVYGELVGHWRPGQRTVARPKPVRERQQGQQTASDPAPPPDEQPAETDDAPDEDSTDDTPDEDVDFSPIFEATKGNPGDMDPVLVRTDWVDLNGFHHDNWPMPNGNILGLSTTIHELTPEQRAAICPDDDTEFNAVSDVIVEFEPDGTVLRTWDIWDAVDVVEFPGSQMCLPEGYVTDNPNRDWTHSNSVVYDPRRDAIIVSVRHTDQIVAFEHLDDLGHQTDVRWILGAGSTMPLDGEPSYHQHAVEVLDETRIIVYDNGNFRPGTSRRDPDNPPYSRAVIYDVDDVSDDPADWTARQLWEHVAVDEDGDPVYAAYIGDADMLANGNVLITHGGIGSTQPGASNPAHALIIEVVPEGESGGEIVWEFRSDPSAPNTSYRSERIESFYVGDGWNPDV